MALLQLETDLFVMIRRAEVVGNATAVKADIGRHDVHVRVTDVDMPVEQPGLVPKVDSLHEIRGDAFHLAIAQVILWREVHGDVDTMFPRTFVEAVEIAESL